MLRRVGLPPGREGEKRNKHCWVLCCCRVFDEEATKRKKKLEQRSGKMANVHQLMMGRGQFLTAVADWHHELLLEGREKGA